MSNIIKGPVQINVGRDLHIHCGAVFDVPDDCVPHRRDFGSGFVTPLSRIWSAIGCVVAALWFLAQALFWLGVGGLLLTMWIVFGSLAIACWVLGRTANAVLFVESKLGGAPTHFVRVPSFLQPQHGALPQLAADHQLRQLDVRQPNSR